MTVEGTAATEPVGPRKPVLFVVVFGARFES